MFYLLLIAVFGFIAEFIDGSAGMGYGVTSATMLISVAGIYPALASASVHTAEIFTALVAGIFHTTFKNVDKKMFIPLVIFGIVGGSLGAYVLVNLPSKIMFITVSIVLIFMGILILLKFLSKKEIAIKHPSKLKVSIIGFIAALTDAVGGGGYGPVGTTSLVLNGAEPRKAIGTINTSEFFVTIAIALTFFLTLKSVIWSVVIPLLIGGIIAAPIASYLCTKINRKYLGIFVGVAVITTMSYKLAKILI
jgi:uncharacterized membrane protein YfcA